MENPEGVCIVEGCDDPAHRDGMCHLHYALAPRMDPSPVGKPKPDGSWQDKDGRIWFSDIMPLPWWCEDDKQWQYRDSRGQPRHGRTPAMKRSGKVGTSREPVSYIHGL